MSRAQLLSFSCFVLVGGLCIADDTVKVGSAAPDFTVTGIDGREFKLSDITGSGKNVALMFSRANW